MSVLKSTLVTLLNFDHIYLQFSVFIIWNRDILQLSVKSIAKWLEVQWDLHGEMLSKCFRNVFFYLHAHIPLGVCANFQAEETFL